MSLGALELGDLPCHHGSRGNVTPPANQEMNKKWSERNIYGWTVRVFYFSFLGTLKSSVYAQSRNSIAISEFRPGEKWPREDAEAPGLNPTWLISPALLGRRHQHPHSWREGETKDCRTGGKLCLTFNSRDIWGGKKPHIQKKKKKLIKRLNTLVFLIT